MLQPAQIQVHHNDTRLILVRDVALAYRTQDSSEHFFGLFKLSSAGLFGTWGYLWIFLSLFQCITSSYIYANV